MTANVGRARTRCGLVCAAVNALADFLGSMGAIPIMGSGTLTFRNLIRRRRLLRFRSRSLNWFSQEDVSPAGPLQGNRLSFERLCPSYHDNG